MPMRQEYLAFAAAVSCVLAAVPAHANGRFPRAQHLLEDHCDPNHLVLSATYGLLTTFDAGRHWFHTCERAFALQEGYNGDPLTALLDDGATLVNVQSALHLSRASGCSFAAAFASAGGSIADFTVNRVHGESILAVTTHYAGGTGRHELFESRDHAATWNAVGAPLPAATIITIDVAPSDPARVYATGLSSSNQGVLLRSDDGGTTWTSVILAGTDSDAVPYVAAVHPHDPNKIFVRTNAWTNRDVIDTAADALFYSADGGHTWAKIIERAAKLLGFAISPDGRQFLVGYGETYDPGVDIDPNATGLFVSSVDAPAPSRVREGSVTCVTWTDRAIYVCTPESETKFQLATTQDPRAPLTPLLRLADLKGPPPGCGATCDWSTACTVFAACGAEPEINAAPLRSAACAGASNPSTDSGDAGSDAQRPADKTPDAAGCGCSAVGAARPFSTLAITLSCTAWLYARARRRLRVTVRR